MYKPTERAVTPKGEKEMFETQQPWYIRLMLLIKRSQNG